MGWMWSSSPSTPKGNDGPVDAGQSKPAQAPAKASEPEYSDPEIAKFMAQIQAEFGGGNSSSSSSSSSQATAQQAQPARPAAVQESKPETRPAAAPNPATSSSNSSSSWSSLWSSAQQQEQPPPPTQASSSRLPASAPMITQRESASFSSLWEDAQSHSDQQPPTRLDPLSESLLPTTMSCRQAFDHAYHCNGLGGQWTSVYREGAVRSCSEQWDDFWFCMRTRAYTGAIKEEAIRDHYRQKELKKYGPGQPSSTDVWEPRTERLPPGAAFGVRYEMPDVSDEEWRRLEIERRRRVQQMLRAEEERASSR
ncbi:Uu.00g066960.m01.CDS01 [Anthostomella pinea]|uniref:Uu.00g066960.m01.CDS01 n=1 Tax=Anthostomella pinea TaxID=933095 RepID=A0AAI8VU27_9PEZI|nr:Uu.00g066960.m01.CDS01 [Anthostomella pinea]